MPLVRPASTIAGMAGVLTLRDRQAGRQMKLGLFANHYHMAGWRHPNAYDDMKTGASGWARIARRLEAAHFDFLFFADSVSMGYFDDPAAFSKCAMGGGMDPSEVCAALSMVTEKLGLISTISTSYSNPFDIARRISTLDSLTQGRIGWNVVTTTVASDAKQYGGAALIPRNERYARAEEYVDVVTSLWDSVEEGAYPANKETGEFADLGKIHKINHRGKYFSVEGPLNGNRSPQGRPILVQAGQSQDGRAFAARIADVVFTAWSEFDMGKRFYDDIKERAAGMGRDPDTIKILPDLRIIAGRSLAEAQEKEDYLNSLLDMDVCRRRAVSGIADGGVGIDLGKYPLDAPFPDLPNEVTTLLSGRSENHLEMARKYNLTLRDILVRSATSNMHFTVKGTASDIVDQMEHWFLGGAADGFNMMCGFLPDSLDDVIELVIPELQRRGLFRTEYEGATLRENLGIPMRSVPRHTVSEKVD